MYKIYVIGIAEPVLSNAQHKILAGCSKIFGARRMQNEIKDLPPLTDLTPLDSALTAMRTALNSGNVAVLASGDPLFHGIGKRLLGEFSPESVEVLPALSSIQRACAHFRLPWDDAVITSLHGRKVSHLPGLLLAHHKQLLLTDGNSSPNAIAETLFAYCKLIDEEALPEEITMLVAEDLGLDSERLFRGSLSEAIDRQFSRLNIVGLLIPQNKEMPPYRFGLGEEQIQHSRGLITKNEVRAATLHHLQLPETGVFWDVGAGSGSLSIETARMNPGLTIYAIEQRKAEIENIKANIRAFRCFNIIPVAGKAPEALAALPTPDRIFVGGSGGTLPEIVKETAARLAPGGLLVINGVIDETRHTAPSLMLAAGLSVTQSTIQVTRQTGDGAPVAFNPITIMSGRK